MAPIKLKAKEGKTTLQTGVKSAETVYPGLILSNFQVKFPKTLRQLPIKGQRIRTVLKCADKVSRPREPPPRPLSEPGVNLSAHRAPIIQPSVLHPFASAEIAWIWGTELA
jgi:hypothetical protein